MSSFTRKNSTSRMIRLIGIRTKFHNFELTAIFIPWLLFLIAVIGKGTKFETNDDPGYLMIAQGAMYGHRSNALLFVGRPIGQILVALYSFAPNIAWYTIVMLGSQALAISYLFLVCLKKTRLDFRNTLAIKLIIVGITSAPIFGYLQMTKASIVITGAGSIIFFLSATRSQYIVSILLIFMGICWRPEGGLLALLTISILYFARICTYDNSRRVVKRLALLGFVGLACYSTTFAFWNTMSPWLSSETRSYIAFNSSRGIIHGTDYASSDRGRQAAAEVGLSSNDYEMFLNWYFADPVVFSQQRITHIAEQKPLTPPFSQLSTSFSKFWKGFVHPNWFELIMGTALCMVCFTNRRVTVMLEPLLVSLLGLCMLFVLAITMRMEDRVFTATFLVIILFNLIDNDLQETDQLSWKRNASKKYSLGTTSFGPMAIVLLTLLVSIYIQRATFERVRYSTEQVNFIKEYNNLKISKPIIACPEFYSFLTFDPFDNPQKVLPHQYLQVNLGTTIRSPDSVRHTRNLGLTDDLVLSLVRGKALLACPSNALTRFSTYAVEHFNQDISWSPQPILVGPQVSIWSTSN